MQSHASDLGYSSDVRLRTDLFNSVFILDSHLANPRPSSGRAYVPARPLEH